MLYFIVCLLAVSSPTLADDPAKQKPQEVIESSHAPSIEKNKDAPLPKFLGDEPAEENNLETAHESHFYRDFMSMLTTLGLMVAGLLFLSWLLRKGMHTRIQQMNESSQIKILESRTLSQRSSVYLIDVQGVKLIVGDSNAGVTLLAKLKSDTEPE